MTKDKDAQAQAMANDPDLQRAPGAPAPTGHPGESREQPIPADAIPTPVDTRHPGEKLAQPVPADPIATENPARPKKTVEEWAAAKGMLHEFAEGKRGPKARPKSKPPMVHNKKFVHFHRAKHSNNWPIGMEMTEAEFDKAIATADGHVYR